jgi:hypothetical protein
MSRLVQILPNDPWNRAVFLNGDMALTACGALLGLCLVARGWLGSFRHDKVQSEIV